MIVLLFGVLAVTSLASVRIAAAATFPGSGTGILDFAKRYPKKVTLNVVAQLVRMTEAKDRDAALSLCKTFVENDETIRWLRDRVQAAIERKKPERKSSSVKFQRRYASGMFRQRTDGSMADGRRFNTDLLSLALTGSRALDRQIEGALLGGEARRIERLTARLTWEHPLDRHWSLIGQIEQTVQTSNIELFGMRNRALYFGVRVHGR